MRNRRILGEAYRAVGECAPDEHSEFTFREKLANEMLTGATLNGAVVRTA